MDIISDLFSPRARTKELAQLSRRLATSLSAGVDMRTVWKREASASGRGCLTRRFKTIRAAVSGGGSMAEGIASGGDFFPPLFRQLAQVAEETGSGAEIFRELAEHYDAQIKRRYIFLAACTWPMIELTITIFVIGLFIWIQGMVGKTDLLGFGLIGSQGLAIYVALVSGAGVVFLLLFQAFHRGLLWIRPVQRLVIQLPVIGPPLQTLALSRLAWVMHLTMNTGMDVRKAMRLSLESTNHARYLAQIDTIDHWIEQGGSIYEAFVHAGGYPAEFLDALHVGEESGRLIASMENLSVQYQDRARLALVALMTVAGFLVWAIVAVVIIIFIFQIAMNAWLGPMYDALNG